MFFITQARLSENTFAMHPRKLPTRTGHSEPPAFLLLEVSRVHGIGSV